MQAYNPNQYYNDYPATIEKTSQPLVTVNWFNVKETLSDVAYGIMGVSVLYLLILIGGIY